MDNSINAIIAYLPLHGPFNLTTKIKDVVTDKDTIQNIKDYLIEKAFAYRRYDVEEIAMLRNEKSKTNFIELTEKGRKLKEFQTLEAYFAWETADNLSQKQKKELEDKLLDNYVFLTTDQRKVDKRNRRITIGLAIGAVMVSIISPLISYYLTKDTQEEKCIRLELKLSTPALDTLIHIQKPTIIKDSN